MVLEEASSSQEPSSASFSESFPSGDVDPYAGDHNPTVLSTRDPSYVRVSPPNVNDPIYVNLNNLPRRWGLPGFTDHPPPMINAIVESCKVASQILERPIRQDEADALAYHFAKSVRISSYGTPVGVSLAMFQAYRTMSTYRFPGWTPGEKWRAKGYPDVFGPLNGQRARMAWQVTRCNAYGFLGAILGQVFFGSYALTVGSAGRLMDPRLKEMSEKIREQVRNGQGGGPLPGNREVDVTAGPREGETLDMARQRQRAQDGYKRSRQSNSQTQTDDMSPTGGAFVDEYAAVGRQENTGMMTDAQVAASNYEREREDTVREQRRQTTEAVRKNPPQTQSMNESSPMSRSDATPKQTGSAWERVRQQASSGNKVPQGRGAQPSVGGGLNDDSFDLSQDSGRR